MYLAYAKTYSEYVVNVANAFCLSFSFPVGNSSMSLNRQTYKNKQIDSFSPKDYMKECKAINKVN